MVRDNEMVVAEDVEAMPKKRALEAAQDGSTSFPASSPDADHEVASPQHSYLADESMSSGFISPHLSSASSASGNSWMLNRPPRLSLNLPPSPYSPGSAISLPESSRWQESPPPHAPSSEFPEEILLPEPWQGLSPPHAPSIASIPQSTPSPAWWQEMPPPSPEPTESDFTPGALTPSQHLSSSSLSSDESKSTVYASASDGSLTSHYFSASDASGGLTGSHNSISEGSPFAPPEDAKFFDENMVKKLKIVGILTIVGGIITGGTIAGTRSKHRDYQDS